MITYKQKKLPNWLIVFIGIAIIIISLYFFKFGDWDFIKDNFEKLILKTSLTYCSVIMNLTGEHSAIILGGFSIRYSL